MASLSNPAHTVPASARSRTPPLLSHFFRIIVDHEVHSKKLLLPRKCARFSFGTKAILETPSGDQWEVDITRDNDGINWFSGHWNAFYVFYFITYGHLLLFRNIGSSRFSDSKQTLNNPPEMNNATTQPANGASRIKEEPDSEYKETQSVPPATPVHHFQSNYPFFRLDLINCCLSATKSVHILMDFVKEHLTIEGITPVILEKGGNVCEARAYLSGKKYVYISWQKFTRSNSITSEETCYFELLATVPLIRFRVTVFQEV